MLKIRNESTTLLSLDPLLNFLLKYMKSLSYLKKAPKMSEEKTQRTLFIHIFKDTYRVWLCTRN